MARTSTNYMAPDTTVLPGKSEESLSSFRSSMVAEMEAPTIKELIEESYGGNKQALVRDLAGIPQGGKLPARGTDERRAYDTANRNVNRYIKAEEGGPGQKRGKSAETQERLKELSAQRAEPGGAVVSITGTIFYNGQKPYDYRYRSTGSIVLSKEDVDEMRQALANGDVQGAYSVIFLAYGASSDLMVGTDAQVEMNFFS